MKATNWAEDTWKEAKHLLEVGLEMNRTTQNIRTVYTSIKSNLMAEKVVQLEECFHSKMTFQQ